MRILLTADLHLGRSSSSVSAGSTGVRAADAWERLVDLAIEREVSLVLISGDVVDHSNRFFEATGPLARGLRRLAGANIDTFGVAGNHDHDVLPALADEYRDFGLRLLGRGGSWETSTVEKPGCPILHMVGWSFPAESHARDPLETFPEVLRQGGPVLGLVHGDLDAARSDYAPLSRARLRGAPVAGWLLGHIHAPSLVEEAGYPWILYPGSPQALDAGEQGRHGVWIAEVSATTVSSPTLVPLSTVQYERVVVDLGGARAEMELRVRLRDCVRARAEGAKTSGGKSLSALVVDLVIEGATAIADRVEPCLEELKESRELDTTVAVEIRKTTNRSTPPLEVETLARGTSLPAVLAKLVLELEAGGCSPTVEDVMTRGRGAVAALPLVSRVKEGDREVPLSFDDPAIRNRLSTAARRVLARLVASGPTNAGGSQA